jgi:NADH-quinone oxidoreductase subunit M
MTLACLIIVAAAGGLLAWLAARWSTASARWISLAALVIDLFLAVSLWVQPSPADRWLAELSVPWIPQFGIRFHLAIDGLSLSLVLLTVLLGIMSVAASWTEIRERVGFFHLNLMGVLAGILGVFLAMDLFLFYFFWELMLVPMYFSLPSGATSSDSTRR